MGVYVLDEMAQFGDLRQIHDSEDDFLVFSAEPALSVEKGGAVMNISQNGVRHFKRFVGNDESRFPWAKPMTIRLETVALMYMAMRVQMAGSSVKIHALDMMMMKFRPKTT